MRSWFKPMGSYAQEIFNKAMKNYYYESIALPYYLNLKKVAELVTKDTTYEHVINI